MGQGFRFGFPCGTIGKKKKEVVGMGKEKRCVMFCAGGFDELLAPVEPDDYVIAADGGFLHTQRLGLTPQVILGDFDSLGYVPEGAIRYPVEKDDTDAMLAIRLGLQAGCREFWLYGSLDGPRLDHTLANLQALAFLLDHNAVGYLIGCREIATAMGRETLSFPQKQEGLLSVFALGGAASGVSIQGLQYALADGALSPSFPLGVSNHFVGRPAHIRVTCGTLTLIWDRAIGLPDRRCPQGKGAAL
jgi:thiamine pyrophosphokinase